ncbi:hypothetical protein GUJ93_ZPchr0001g30184 [Zizania palustris]|uniref:Uncharacterized protein n=1 Tax=Zizania palustris TaxID=103762 RepID=A0A8J5RFG3_ZIZPA|nr:hypothetical protein GUJ93_ZPchr0001g30184 [Zizania palustris]
MVMGRLLVRISMGGAVERASTTPSRRAIKIGRCERTSPTPSAEDLVPLSPSAGFLPPPSAGLLQGCSPSRRPRLSSLVRNSRAATPSVPLGQAVAPAVRRPAPPARLQPPSSPSLHPRQAWLPPVPSSSAGLPTTSRSLENPVQPPVRSRAKAAAASRVSLRRAAAVPAQDLF